MGQRVGQTVGEGGGLVTPGPSKTAEAFVALLIPPACREEVLGDLHERYTSPGQYVVDVLLTVPMVIVSRIRRTSDPQVRLMQATVLYLSFLGAAWFKDGAFLYAQWGLPRLAVPAGMALLGLTIADAYAKPGRPSLLALVRSLVFGLGLAYLSQAVLWASGPDLAVPGWIMFYGCALSALLISAVRVLFPPATEQPLGANAPALWLQSSLGPAGNHRVLVRVVQGIAAIVAAALVAALVGTWIADQFPILQPRLGLGLLMNLLIVACLL